MRTPDVFGVMYEARMRAGGQVGRPAEVRGTPDPDAPVGGQALARRARVAERLAGRA